ncbi:MAG: WecB/TagA/CpsF family glycosyltransferase, partial [Planctomycetota bacterium]
QKTGLEWFWRLIKEPRRLWKRYLIDDMKFFVLLLKQKLSKKKQNQKPVLRI